MTEVEKKEPPYGRRGYFLDTLFEFDIVGATCSGPSFSRPKQKWKKEKDERKRWLQAHPKWIR